MTEAYICDYGDCGEVMKYEEPYIVQFNQFDTTEYHLCKEHVKKVKAFVVAGGTVNGGKTDE